MIPVDGPDNRQAHEGDAVELQGRPLLTIDTFRIVAREVAAELGTPIAICRREEHESGSAAVPFKNQTLAKAQADGSFIEEVVHPPSQDL